MINKISWLFYSIGKFFELPYRIKKPPGGCARKCRGNMSLRRRICGAESRKRDSFSS